MALGTAAAILGSAVIGGVVSSSAASKAAKSSQQATDQATALAREQYQQTRADNEPFRQAGSAAINPLMAQLGISAGGTTGSSPAPAAPTQDWAAYIAANPDVAAAVNAPNSGYAGDTPEARAADQYARYGQGEGRVVPTVAAPVAAQPTTATTSTNPFLVDPTTGGVNTLRPTADPRETYTRPDTPAFSYGLDEYKASPGYQYRQDEARKSILSSAGATGALQSGAALKELYDRGDQIAYQDFGNERAFAYDQYGADRARTDQNFAADRAYGTDIYNTDRTYGDSLYNLDRGYATDTYNNRTNNLFNLTSLGASTNNANASAGNTATGLQTNALFSNAATQGNAALTQANSFNNILSTGLNAYAYNQGQAGVGTKANPASSFSGFSGGTSANPLLSRSSF